jgi:hypothetical protein
MKLPLKPVMKTAMICGLSAMFVGCANHAFIDDFGNADENEFYQSAAFDECASLLSENASAANNPAKYHLTAKQAMSCLEDAPLAARGELQTSVMQVHALAIVNLVKSGQLDQAQSELSNFKQQFPRRDLMLMDGSSFVDTLELLLGEAPIEMAANGSLLNASNELKSELRRQQYWQVN